MIKTDADYLHRAMQAYDNPACVSLEEFQYDLNGTSTIKRAIRKYATSRDNLHRLVNHIIIFYNCFGKDSTDLLLYKIQEQEQKILVPILMHLGWVEAGSLSVSIDSQTVTELQEIFKYDQRN